jgi:hypothetical protein
MMSVDERYGLIWSHGDGEGFPYKRAPLFLYSQSFFPSSGYPRALRVDYSQYTELISDLILPPLILIDLEPISRTLESSLSNIGLL